MCWPTGEPWGLVIDITLCCVLLFVIFRVERAIKPAGSAAGRARSSATGERHKQDGNDLSSLKPRSGKRYDAAVAMAARGASPETIARKLGMTAGEVSLVLDLDRSKKNGS
ncbi:MAG: hypothetical protein AVO39_10095 [delta proteobacterium MLS_D]|jgi:hypothetical protein|nr:MAG: hypothetical protein AVO39_10095 [delta proteobacterium MLS_D]